MQSLHNKEINNFKALNKVVNILECNEMDGKVGKCKYNKNGRIRSRVSHTPGNEDIIILSTHFLFTQYKKKTRTKIRQRKRRNFESVCNHVWIVDMFSTRHVFDLKIRKCLAKFS